MTSVEKKKYAAVLCALSWTRSLLNDVLEDRANIERVREVLNATSTDEIAKAIKLSKADLSVDVNEQLTEEERWKISGRGGGLGE